MDIIKIAIEWARAEVFSARFFILFGVLFVLGAIGFWQLGKTEVARAFIYPTMVAGVLLLTVGVGIFFANKSRITSFQRAYEEDPVAFVESEITRTQQSMNEYSNIVFKIIPFIMVAAALLIVFVDKPIWRAIGISTIAMMVVILFVDSNANARIQTYHEQLQAVSDKSTD